MELLNTSSFPNWLKKHLSITRSLSFWRFLMILYFAWDLFYYFFGIYWSAVLIVWFPDTASWCMTLAFPGCIVLYLFYCTCKFYHTSRYFLFRNPSYWGMFAPPRVHPRQGPPLPAAAGTCGHARGCHAEMSLPATVFDLLLHGFCIFFFLVYPLVFLEYILN